MAIWLVVWNMFIFHILGISSSQLTFVFFRGVGVPPTSNGDNTLRELNLAMENGHGP